MDKLLKDLLMAPSVSGNEEPAVKVFDDFMKSYFTKHESDNIGNSYFKFGTGEKKIMISAHIDQIGFQVSAIGDDGKIYIDRVGGIDMKTVPGSRVDILTSRGIIPGVIGKPAIHTEKPENRREVDKLSSLFVDCGFENKSQVEEGGIFPGTYVTYHLPEPLELRGGKISSPGLDDKIGVWIVAKAAEELIKRIPCPSNYTIYFVATTQEELGLRGAKVAAKRINPDISIDLDVTFATSSAEEKADFGDVKMGDGIVISTGPDKNKTLVEELREVSALCPSVKSQVCYSGAGGTNTYAIQELGLDTMTGLLSIPCDYMHTQTEVINMEDAENGVKLIVEWLIRKLK